MRVSIYTPEGKHLETTCPKQRCWRVSEDEKEGGLHIRFVEFPEEGPTGGVISDRIKIYGSVIVIIQEEASNS